ncbi:MAG: hypothetical protein L7H09_07140, partial [Acidilobus sp.]|nr:hypothetical protein [Acidilobus sp.]
MRSYKAVVAAVVLALVLLAPLLGQMAKAAAYPQPGTGIVYTKVVSVNGVVTFDFNITPAYQGAAAHIYLSANGLPNVYFGDVAITPAFSTTNVTAIVGNLPITLADVVNFISNLSYYASTEDHLSSGYTQEEVVLHNLTTQHWAFVYLKYSTSAPVNYSGSAPAIAAGPFMLAIGPSMKVTIEPVNNLSVAPLPCLLTSNKTFLNITGINAYASGVIGSTASNVANYNLTLLGSFVSSTVSTKPLTIAFISKLANHSQVFSSVELVNHTSTSMGIKGTLSPTFAPPALTNSVHFSSGVVTSYFNISNFSLKVVYNKPITVVPANGTTYVEFFPNGTYVYGTNTGTKAAVSFYVVNYTLTNYGINPSTSEPYGNFTPSPAAGTLDIFPSFNVTSENMGVAGPSGYLNPGDLLNITFYNLPEDTSLVITYILKNNHILPTTHFYQYEENVKSFYNESGYYIVTSVGTFGPFSNLTFTNKTYLGSGEATVGFVIPNAPYYPAAELGLEFEISYTPEYVSGTISPYANVSNCELQYNGQSVTVFPFYQVFTSNANGMFYYNTTPTIAPAEGLLFGNYLLVRGFGFNTTINYTEYPAMANAPTAPTAYTTLMPITEVQTDGYGDFAYISQVPISGSFYNYLVTQIPTSGFNKVSAYVLNPTFMSIEGNATYEVYLNANPNASIVYVDPTPVVNSSTLLGEIKLPKTLFKYPFEATQYITNGTTHLIPASEGMIHE